MLDLFQYSIRPVCPRGSNIRGGKMYIAHLSGVNILWDAEINSEGHPFLTGIHKIQQIPG